MSDTLLTLMNYEPHKNNRFIVKFPSDMGIQSWWVSASGLPAFNVAETEVPFMNTKAYIAGQYSWDTIEVKFRNFIGPSTVQALMEWVRLCAESVTGRMGYKAGYARDITIEQLDPSEVTVSKWLLKNAWISKLSQDGLSYDDDKINETSVTLRYDYAVSVY